MAKQELAPDAPVSDPMAEYRFDVELILDGFERLVERSATR